MYFLQTKLKLKKFKGAFGAASAAPAPPAIFTIATLFIGADFLSPPSPSHSVDESR
jgi:hypothetical protein